MSSTEATSRRFFSLSRLGFARSQDYCIGLGSATRYLAMLGSDSWFLHLLGSVSKSCLGLDVRDCASIVLRGAMLNHTGEAENGTGAPRNHRRADNNNNNNNNTLIYIAPACRMTSETS